MKVRIYSADYAISNPLQMSMSPLFPNQEISKVPVIRVFGRIEIPPFPSACVLVHGVYPYFYLPLREKIDTLEHNVAVQVAHTLDDALKKSLRGGDLEDEHVNSMTCEFVYNVSLFNGFEFYGFHDLPSSFLKIELSRPHLMSKLVGIIHSKASVLEETMPGIVRSPLQCFESHIPYIMQFFADHNLYGMGIMEFDKYFIRQPLPTKNTLQGMFANELANHAERLSSHRIRRISFCDFEIDTFGSEVHDSNLKALEFDRFLSPENLASCNFKVQSLQMIWDQERKRRRNQGVSSFISKEVIARDSNDFKFHNDYILKVSEAFRSHLKNYIESKSFSRAKLSRTDAELVEAFRDIELLSASKINDIGPNDPFKNVYNKEIDSRMILVSTGMESNESQEIEESQREFETLVFSQSEQTRKEDVAPVASTENVQNEACLFRMFSSVYAPQELPPDPLGIIDLLNKKSVASTNNDFKSFLQEILKFSNYSEPISPKYDENDALFSRSYSQSSLSSQSSQNCTNLKIMSIEVVFNCRENMLPDPRIDEAMNIYLCIYEDSFKSKDCFFHIVLSCSKIREIHDKSIHEELKILHYETEESMFYGLIEIFREADPDIVLGFEIQKASIGILVDRFKILLSKSERFEFPLDSLLGRIQPFKRKNGIETSNFQSDLSITGRIVLDLWKIIRSESTLSIYTYENCVFQILKKRVPSFSDFVLSDWIKLGNHTKSIEAINYMMSRVKGNIELVFSLNILHRTSELARLFGILFYEVLSRGSQFRVESILVRLTKFLKYVMVSPTKEQVAQQQAMECVPLVMEPESKVYYDPIVVLDFQSLYPSIIIAYNICFSTCLGKVFNFDKSEDAEAGFLKFFGCYNLKIREDVLKNLLHDFWFSSNGSMFVSPKVRKGILPLMLQEILETRVMLKQTMKRIKSVKDENWEDLYQALDSQQFGLKMIANVTYGYTSAGFSGRMPCADIADAIVQTGRDTLERAIRMVESNQDWKARVVYGDTDSMFVHLEGRTKEEAFSIGKQIAEAVTLSNPNPIKLQMEKVFHPCALIAKKRYVGYAWENAKQESPIFDDKGIETVRRDSCPIVSETLRESIKLLFEDRYDRFNLKRFLMQKFSVILNGNIAINKYLFAKEVRLGTYSNSGLPPPAAIVSQRNMLKDPRSEPLHAQRVQYLVVYGIPGSRLADLVVSPDEYFSDSTLQVNGSYYIKKQIIPAISRVLELAGVDINLWFSQLPKSHINFTRPRKVLNKAGSVSKSSYTLDQFFQSSRCKNCGAVKAKSKLCEECSADPVGSSIQWTSKQYYSDLSYGKLIRICSACTAKTTKSNRVEWKVPCTSFDCPVLFFKHKADDNLQETFLLELF